MAQQGTAWHTIMSMAAWLAVSQSQIREGANFQAKKPCTPHGDFKAVSPPQRGFHKSTNPQIHKSTNPTLPR
jgi:hypothetical protein